MSKRDHRGSSMRQQPLGHSLPGLFRDFMAGPAPTVDQMWGGPSGPLVDAVRGMHPMSQAALATSFVPVVGDLAGLAADARMYAQEPESRTLGNLGLSALGMLPFVPALSTTKAFPGRFLNEINDSGRYDIRSAGKKAGRDEYEYDIKGTDDWPLAPGSFLRDPDTGATFPKRSQPYNPEIATPRAVEDKFGVTVQFDLKPGWSRDISPPEGDFIYRGMSWEEWENIQKTGRIRSMGDYNMSGDQQGLTYFSTEPGVAAHYGTGFAPAQYSPAPARPAVVVAISRREGVRVPGTGRDEVGVPGHIDASEIRHVWEGHPYAVTRSGSADIIEEFGQIRDGSRFDPSVPVAWRKAK